MTAIVDLIANELQVKPEQVSKTIQLLDEGNTIPFIARYRKEVTGGLDDIQLRNLDVRLIYLRELEARKQSIVTEIESQGKMTPALLESIHGADTKSRLEDLYRPYKPKRKTRAQIALAAGLGPLAEQLMAEPTQVPLELAAKFINSEHKIDTAEAALDGAKFILMEQIAEQPDLVGEIRELLWEEGFIVSEVKPEQKEKGKHFADYFEFREKIKIIPSHRALAILRGRNKEILKLNIETETCIPSKIAAHVKFNHQGRPADDWLQTVIQWAWQVKMKVHLEVELITRMREKAEKQAISVFAENLKDVLMAPPAGYKVTLGLDPGLRTGVKWAVVEATGKLLEYGTIFPHAPQNKWDEAIATLAAICQKNQVELVSIGNGTASRETDQLVIALQKQHPELKFAKMIVSEAGASVYSASEFASKEFPDLDVSIRSAVSIARRIQDPLAELVKIEPKAIGVGQYQHDVSQLQLAKTLDSVVEDCVNAVGVDVNTASAPLLARVAGLNQLTASQIVAWRDTKGMFKTREQLKQVSRLGPKAFEQAAGFLRILNGDNALDASGVHPESYEVVTNILDKLQQPISTVIGKQTVLNALHARDFVTEQFGLPTVQDILRELEKPGRDPRPEFKTANFNSAVQSIDDLKPDMILEGVVTNVADFGAFVDVGVHQEGLVHISEMVNRFIKDPREVVRTGEIVKVKIKEVDKARRRISLTMKLSERVAPGQQPERATSSTSTRHTGNPAKSNAKPTHKGQNGIQQTKFKSHNAKAKQKQNMGAFGSALKAALKDVEPEMTN